MGQRHVYHLQAVTNIAKVCAMLLVIKDMRGSCGLWLALERNASMQGVGTKMGTVLCPPFGKFRSHPSDSAGGDVGHSGVAG